MAALLLQEANQQILRNNLWMIDAYNSTTKVAWSNSFRMRSYGEPRPTQPTQPSIKMCYKLDNDFDVFPRLYCFIIVLSCFITWYHFFVIKRCTIMYVHLKSNQCMVLLNTLSLGGFPLGLQILGQILCLVLHLAAVSKPRDSAGKMGWRRWMVGIILSSHEWRSTSIHPTEDI